MSHWWRRGHQARTPQEEPDAQVPTPEGPGATTAQGPAQEDPTAGRALRAPGTRSVHVLVSGTVQGVGFRYYCQEEAQRLGLAGTVRNLDDGDVEVLARGPRHRVDALIAWLHRGPRWSRVTGGRVTEMRPDAVRGTSFQVGN